MYVCMYVCMYICVCMHVCRQMVELVAVAIKRRLFIQ